MHQHALLVTRQQQMEAGAEADTMLASGNVLTHMACGGTQPFGGLPTPLF